MASGPITSWQIDGETMETLTDFILGGSIITADYDCSHEIKRCLLSGGSEVKASACNTGDLGLILGLERSPGERNSNPLQYSCLENPMDRGAWQAIIHGVAKSWTRLSFPGGSDGKESTCNVGYLDLIPGLGRSSGEGNTHSSILVWRIPWTEEPGGIQPMGATE